VRLQKDAMINVGQDEMSEKRDQRLQKSDKFTRSFDEFYGPFTPSR
jgi:hypothetical protein